MRITVQVSVDTPDHTEPVVREVFTLKRDALGPDLLGPHLAEAHELLTAPREVLAGARISQALAQRATPELVSPRARFATVMSPSRPVPCWGNSSRSGGGCIPRGSARNSTTSPPDWRPNPGRRTPRG